MLKTVMYCSRYFRTMCLNSRRAIVGKSAYYSTTNVINSSGKVTASASSPELFAGDNSSVSSLDAIRREFRNLKGGEVLLTKDDDSGVAYICLNHVEKKNGFSGSMMVDLSEIVTDLEKWESGKAIILHGKGNTFCSGGYLDTVKQICNHKDGFKMSSLMQDTVIRLSKLPLVSVSVVHGQAIGGGAELMLSTDFCLFTPSAECRYVEAKMGVGTGWGGGTLLRRRIGPSRSLQLLLTGQKVGATDAIVMGLADGIVSEENALDDSAKWILNLVGDHPGSVVRAVKQIVACDNFEEEKRIFATTWGGPAQLNALSRNIKHK